MAYTIQQSFEELRGNLEPTGMQKQTISTRQTNVRAAVESELKVLDSFLTGSYSRSTLISPLAEADIDVLVVLHSDYFYHYNGQNGGQAGLLDFVKGVIRKTYTKTPDISRNGQAVTIRFTDFVVDVVPGFSRQGGGYLIPNSISQNWISTDPQKHVDIFSAANKSHNGDLVPLIKMIKGWNKNTGQYFTSFHLEVMALHVLSNVTITDFPSGVRFYFDKAREYVKKQNPDPAGFGGDIGYYINTAQKITDAVDRIQLAYEKALKAEQYESLGKTENAIEMWRKIFGDYFPAYG